MAGTGASEGSTMRLVLQAVGKLQKELGRFYRKTLPLLGQGSIAREMGTLTESKQEVNRKLAGRNCIWSSSLPLSPPIGET